MPPVLLKGVGWSPLLNRVPGETLGSSVVVVASLLEGVVGYRRFGALGAWCEVSVGVLVVESGHFCRSAVVGIFSPSFLFSFLLGVLLLFPPQQFLLGVVLSGPAAVSNGVALFIKRGASLIRETRNTFV